MRQWICKFALRRFALLTFSSFGFFKIIMRVTWICMNFFPETLAKCQYDADCMKNAYCWNQEACLCKENYIVYKNRTHVECLKGKIFPESFVLFLLSVFGVDLITWLTHVLNYPYTLSRMFVNNFFFFFVIYIFIKLLWFQFYFHFFHSFIESNNDERLNIR